ncbi:hypothetical protein D1AOALGA4SA_2041 [Olavius algarvensis Delta 1 endosymbiont]|nr:hypothetical protein D1AOALGA4SA_2041 [Olavius algarvensis Delta 1 endosymbiont]
MESIASTFLIGQFLHENWSIKTEILVFLELFSQFFSTLLWPDPRGTLYMLVDPIMFHL